MMKLTFFFIFFGFVNIDASIKCSSILQKQSRPELQLRLKKSFTDRFRLDPYVQNLAFDMLNLQFSDGRIGSLNYAFTKSADKTALEIHHLGIEGLAIGEVSQKTNIDVPRFLAAVFLFLEQQLANTEKDFTLKFSAIKNRHLLEMITGRISASLNVEIFQSYAGQNVQIKFQKTVEN